MSSLDLKEREEQAAGNADDSLNPGNRHYNEDLINQKKNASDEEISDDFNDILAANGLDAPDKKTNARGEEIKRNYNADDREEVQSQEQAGDDPSLFTGSGSKSGNGKQKFKGLVPAGGIVTLILFALIGVGGGTSYIASSLLVNIKEALHNDRADGTRANQVFSRATIAKKIGYKGAGCGVVAIKCRMGTMSENERLRYERAGFKLEGRTIGTDGKVSGSYESPDKSKTPTTSDKDTSQNRYIIDKITFPDGNAVTSGDGFFKYAKAKASMQVAALKAFNPRSDFFLNERFNNILGKTFNFAKGRVLTGKTKAEIDKSFNDNTGGVTEEEVKSGAKKTKVQEEVEKQSGRVKSGAGSGIASIAGGELCHAYNITRYTIAAIKLARLYELVSFALPWLQAADQIKDQGSIKPEIVDNLSDRLTASESNETLTEDTTYNGKTYKAGSKNPKYNLTATDSQGYKIAVHKDRSQLKDFARVWLLGGDSQSIVSKIDSTLTSITSMGGSIDPKTGETGIRTACKVLNSPTTGIIGMGALALDCLSTFIGNVATGPQGCAVAAAWVAGGIAVNIIVDKLGEQLTEYAVKSAVEGLHLGSDTNGVDAGDAMAAGVGLMLGTVASSSGLRPSKSTQESQDYITFTDSINNEYIAAEQYDARDTPFDIYNQYSFLGSIASKFQATNMSQAPLFGSFSSIASILSTAFLGKPATVDALYSQPSSDQAERYDCQDPDLLSIGAIGDKFCSIATLMPPTDLQDALDQISGKKESIDEVIDYMTTDQDASEADGGTLDDSFGGDGDFTSKLFDITKSAETTPKSAGRSIDDDGKPIAGTQYALYLKYCSDNRVTSESQTTWTGEQGAGTYWGTSKHDIEKDSNRDQDWYSGKQCTDPIGSKMMRMFRQYTNYCLQIATMQGTETCWQSAAAVTSANGDACSLLNNPNIVFVGPANGIPGGGPGDGTKQGLKEICEKGSSINSCGKSGYTLDQELMNVVTTLSSKYKVWLNNFGFKYDRNSCDTGQHPKGKAVDLNGIEKLDGSGRAGGTGWGGITYGDPKQVAVINSYATDWLATINHSHGGVGQQGCSSSFKPTFPSDATNVNGAAFFPDSCDHLHIDVRDRGAPSAL